MSPSPPADPELVRRLRELAGSGSRSNAAGEAAPWGWVPAPPPGARTAPRVLTLPGFLRGARLRTDRRATLALVAIVLAAGLVFAVRVAVATGEGDPVLVGPHPSGRETRSSAGQGPPHAVSSPPGDLTFAPTSGGGTPPVRVHVVGEVAKPGVVTLGAGSRVADALVDAGGPLPSADLERVNLARLLADGEQIHVPAPGEAPALPAAPSTSTATTGTVVDLNTADVAALDSLPGVGPVLAARILEWRAAHGRFTSVEELGEVSGIGDKLLAQLRPRVTVARGPGR